VYDGPYVGDGPDLVPIARDHKMLGFSGDGALFDPDDDWIAGHEMDGLFVANGPDFRTGEVTSLALYDAMPTLLHVSGYDIPRDVDGTVRRDLLAVTSERRRANSETRGPLGSVHGRGVTDDDRERMNERLEQLGYKT
jgi:hypothetical protein